MGKTSKWGPPGACLLRQKRSVLNTQAHVYLSCACKSAKPLERLHWEDLPGATYLCLNSHTNRIEISKTRVL